MGNVTNSSADFSFEWDLNNSYPNTSAIIDAQDVRQNIQICEDDFSHISSGTMIGWRCINITNYMKDNIKSNYVFHFGIPLCQYDDTWIQLSSKEGEHPAWIEVLPTGYKCPDLGLKYTEHWEPNWTLDVRAIAQTNWQIEIIA